MYLSRVLLDTSKRKTQIALVSPNKFHGAVEETCSEREDRKLWRIDTLRGETYLIILSANQPDLSGIEEQFGYRDIKGESKNYDGLLSRIKEGGIWYFRLVANPVHSINRGEGRGKVTAHTSVKYQLEWLYSQSKKRGFSILPDSAHVMQTSWKIFNKRDSKQKVRILEVAFEGKLKVENADIFKHTLLNGIGREKAYGMGLLTIVRAEV